MLSSINEFKNNMKFFQLYLLNILIFGTILYFLYFLNIINMKKYNLNFIIIYFSYFF